MEFFDSWARAYRGENDDEEFSEEEVQAYLYNTTSWKGGNVTKPKPPCHPYGNSKLYQKNGLTLYASGAHHGVEVIPNGLHINLGPQDSWHESGITQCPPSILPELDQYKAPEEIRIGWRDYGVPSFGARFWVTLAEGLQRLSKERGGLSVVVFCMGGHGRTGTAISILLGLWGVTRPIRYVKRAYCKNVVETKGQQQYIERILGDSKVVKG